MAGLGLRQAAAVRMALELLGIIVGCELAVMFLLLVIAPGVDGWQEALLDAALLACLASPLVVWRAQSLFAEEGLRAPGPQDQASHFSKLWSVVTFVVGVMLAWGAAWSVHTNELDAAQVRFDRASGQIEDAIQIRVERAVHGFKGLRSTMSTLNRELTPQEFRTWVTTRFKQGELPGIRGVGFIKHVMRKDLDQWVEYERAHGANGFAVRTSGDAPDLYVICRIEPIENNRKAWGFDVGSEAARRKGIEDAIRTGEVTLTRRITLLQDGKKRPGFLLYMPMYKPGATLVTAQDRMANLMGVIYAPIVVEEFLEGIGKDQSDVLHYGVYDSPDPSKDSLLAGTLITGKVEKGEQLRRHYFMYMGGQALTLAVEAAPSFETVYGRSGPLWVGMLGTVLSAVLALAIWLLRSGRGRAEALADAMTHDLQEAKRDAERALRESEALLATLDRFSTVCITKPDGTLVHVNDMYCRLSGYSRDELLGQNPRLLTSGAHDSFFWVEVWRSLLHGTPWTGQVCNKSKSGKLYWVQTVIAPIKQADGTVDKYISFGYDITEAKQTQDEMNANAERYNLAIDGGNDGLWDWMNVHAQEEWWSPQFYRLLGYQPNEISADLVTFDAMLHPDHQQSTFAALEDALRNNKPFDLEYMLRTKSGEYRWFRSRAKVYFDDFGAATRMAGSIQDIHDRKMAQAKIKEHSEQMGAIFSLSPDGFVSFDAQGKVAYASPAFDSLTSMPEGWSIGMTEAEFSARFFQQAAPDQLIQSVTEIRQHAGRVVLEMKPPARRMLEVRLSRGQGTAVSQVLAIRDVTHESEVDQMKSAFLSMAAHELRTPMASIYGFTELLLTRELKPEKQKDLLGRIYRQSETMSGIINELLDLARIESRQGKDFTLGAEDLSDLVHEVIQDFKTPEGRDAPIVDVAVGETMVWVDRKKMQQAVLNVLSNAYKYSPKGGEVKVQFLSRAVEGQAQLGIQIIDQGIGLSPDQLARVGERFYRADKSGNIPGTGLGVTIVKEILELMGGTMDLASEFGQGTQVTLWVPQMVLNRVHAAMTEIA